MDKYLMLIPYLVAGFGVFILLLSLQILKRQRRFNCESITVEGTVVSVRAASRPVDDEPGTFWPVITFPDGKGAVAESADAGYGAGKDAWKVGSKVSIRLIPGQPHTARIDTPLFRAVPLIVVLVFGFGFTLVGGGLVVMHRMGFLR